MTIDENIQQRLESLFPGVILDPDIDGKLHIRTDNWQITSDEFCALLEMGLEVDHIYSEGGGVITLVITKESSKKAFKNSELYDKC